MLARQSSVLHIAVLGMPRVRYRLFCIGLGLVLDNTSPPHVYLCSPRNESP